MSGETELSAGAEVKVGNGKVSGDVMGSAKGEADSFVKGGVYHEANGDIIGVNGGLNGRIGGVIRGGGHGEAGLNKDGSISARANSNLTTTGYTRVGAHANIATGDAERRHVAEFEGKTIESSADDPGTEMDLVPLLSTVVHIVDHFWLYLCLCIGCVVFIICCCLFTVCGGYWKLVSDVNSLKKEMKTEPCVTQEKVDSKECKVAFDKKHNMDVWDTHYEFV